ncbi:hypothetical protein ANAEL_04095 [Anaerolineales bacterium]|nr:hypothetical protein ANAEL_04095 [Anaerolineales bacterium]
MVDRRIVAEKVDSAERSLKRVNSHRGESLEQFLSNNDAQDIVLFHLMQAIQGCIDLAAHVVSDEEMGLAASTRDFFYLLSDNGVISRDLSERMIKAVGFRNLVAHEYAKLDLEKVYAITADGVKDVEEFLRVLVRRYV